MLTSKKQMNFCELNKKINQEVKDFLTYCREVKEESITDFLVWQWSKADPKFKFLKISTFTRQQESDLTGADFQLELWLVGHTFRYPLIFQAKKLIKQHDRYLEKLNYPNYTQNQLKTLLKYASAKKFIPFYMLYGLPDKSTKSMCSMNFVIDCGAFMIRAEDIQKLADLKKGSKVSKDDLLFKSNPFYCMFCCPLTQNNSYFDEYFHARSDENQVPHYIRYLMDTDELSINSEEIQLLIQRNELNKYRYVAVYDMRELDESPNQTS